MGLIMAIKLIIIEISRTGRTICLQKEKLLACDNARI
jgi:uncharacterized protein (AIM24 family)